jgi:GNAT superfamily N-acetyltransferase
VPDLVPYPYGALGLRASRCKLGRMTASEAAVALQEFSLRHKCDLTLASSSDHFRTAVSLEREIFAGHEPASLAELKLMAEHGLLFLLHASERPIGEAQVLFERLSGLGRLEAVLPNESAFLEGLGLAAVARGRGLQRLLIGASEELARTNGKQTIYTAVREGNGASLRQFFKSGYCLVAADQAHYGSSASHARLILEHDFRDTGEIYADVRLGSVDQTDGRVIRHGDLIGIVVEDGDQPDVEAQRLIASLLLKSHVGVNLYSSHTAGKNILVLIHMSLLRAGRRMFLEERRTRLARSYSLLLSESLELA